MVRLGLSPPSPSGPVGREAGAAGVGGMWQVVAAGATG